MKLRNFLNETFGNSMYENSYIEVSTDGEIVISANREGLICLVDTILKVCEGDAEGFHLHIDEASIVDKCDKPLVIQFVKEPWNKE